MGTKETKIFNLHPYYKDELKQIESPELYNIGIPTQGPISRVLLTPNLQEELTSFWKRLGRKLLFNWQTVKWIEPYVTFSAEEISEYELYMRKV